MKKFNSLFATFLTAILLTSCLDKDDVTLSPMTPGINLYNSAIPQNTMSLDPTEIAIRLNILLSTANYDGGNFDGTQIQVNGVDVNLRRYLFNTNTVTTSGEGIYKINFENTINYGTGDRPRTGTIVIDTGRKLLEEMEEGDQWTVWYEGNAYTLGIYDRGNWYGYYVEFDNPYTITCTGDRKWAINCTGIKGYHESDTEKEYQGNFNIEYELEYNQQRMNYTAMRSSNFSLKGGGSGRLAYFAVQATYAITSPIVYKMSCSPPVRSSGVERVQIPEYKTNAPDDFPEDFVRVRWKSGDSCSSIYYMSYNGVVYDYTGGVSEEVF